MSFPKDRPTIPPPQMQGQMPPLGSFGFEEGSPPGSPPHFNQIQRSHRCPGPMYPIDYHEPSSSPRMQGYPQGPPLGYNGMHEVFPSASPPNFDQFVRNGHPSRYQQTMPYPPRPTSPMSGLLRPPFPPPMFPHPSNLYNQQLPHTPPPAFYTYGTSPQYGLSPTSSQPMFNKPSHSPPFPPPQYVTTATCPKRCCSCKSSTHARSNVSTKKIKGKRSNENANSDDEK